ncbi:MAG: AraC family ligand binding domain-containing protein [Bacteroidota bacterium]
MRIRSRMEEAKRKLDVSFFNVGRLPKKIDLPVLSEDWAPFGVVEGDRAKAIHTNDLTSFSMIYDCGMKPCMFPNHVHDYDEIGIVVCGSLTFETPWQKEHLTQGGTFTIEKDEPHLFFMQPNTRIILMYPGATSWIANT